MVGTLDFGSLVKPLLCVMLCCCVSLTSFHFPTCVMSMFIVWLSHLLSSSFPTSCVVSIGFVYDSKPGF